MFHEDKDFQKCATTTYDPIKIGSIDGTDTEPHDRAILRAIHSEYVPNKLVKGDPHHTIFVARLNPRTTQDTIYTEFSKFGKIVNCRLVKDIVTGKSKQYAFVEYASSTSVDQALREMYKEYVEGAEIIVEREAERRLQGWKPRRLGGGFGGKRESGQLRFGCSERPFKRPLLVSSKNDKNEHFRKKT
ncbi:U11/U12 small nuclear ribonucleoprotein 35 kDa protein-like [Maniola jurtina]|uniref:U11/U12 small nuclear ribonucleoprotein 35 kDa protein-like n=1 Tax=Maniola jurtina TaxID=191418 RepID=UPI001E68772A|nr:U11/U12 small nuclear ribonucleoprotein 35 kDa protein-like [Maniola jurtina]